MGMLRCNEKALLFLVPELALYYVFFICPFLETTVYNLMDRDGSTAPAWVGMENFKWILTDQAFREVVIRIFIRTVLSILFEVGMTLVIAYVLTEAIWGIGFFRFVVFLSYIILASAMCLMFTTMYDKDIGLINMSFKAVGLGKYAKYRLSDPRTAFYAVILIPVYQVIGCFFAILFTAMKDIPSDLYEAGKMDGTNFLTEFFPITLPTVWLTLVVCIALAVSGVFQNFDYTLIMTYGGPGHASEVSVTYMYKSIFVSGEHGYGSVAVLILFVPTMVVTNCVRKGLNFEFITDREEGMTWR